MRPLENGLCSGQSSRDSPVATCSAGHCTQPYRLEKDPCGLQLLILTCALADLADARHLGPGGARQHDRYPLPPCVLVNAETLPLLRAKCAAEEPTRFGFTTADFWADAKAKAGPAGGAAHLHYRPDIPGEAPAILEEWAYTLSDQTPPPHPKSPAYPPWTAMFQERADAISTRLIHFSFAYLVTGEDAVLRRRPREIALHLAKWEPVDRPAATAAASGPAWTRATAPTAWPCSMTGASSGSPRRSETKCARRW